MATAIVTKVLDSGGGSLLNGLSNVINSIKGKNPGDAEKLQELLENNKQAFELAQLQQAHDQLQAQVELAKDQTDTNKIEAGVPAIFVAGWRPFVGWVCGLGLMTQFLVRPLFMFISALCHHPTDFPSLDMGTLLTLLLGILGLGAARTVEKIQGAA
ncbi:MAG TPA: 3TM-type holin [Candidatus Angelobacter sp.]|nr:3TM-type holin [Candidatus Angelobacter sp.]